MKELIELFLTFFKIGGVTFGGGYAMLPMIRREITDKKKWATEQEVLDYYALGQCTPGIIAVNTSTFIGYKRRGILGAIFSTLGMITPSIIIITIIAIFFGKFQENIYVQYALSGINIAVVALILKVVIRMIRKAFKGIFGYVLGIISFLAITAFSVSPVIVIITAASIGLIDASWKIYQDDEEEDFR
ncbi:MAG: chromate transporter [Fusobacteriota bacterium]